MVVTSRDPLGERLGALLGRLGGLLGRLGAILGRLGAHLVRLGPSWTVLAASWCPLGPSWSPLGSEKVMREDARRLGRFGILGSGPPLGAVLGASWGLLGASWGRELQMSVRVSRLGPLLEPSWGALGPSWRPLGAVLARLGPLLGPNKSCENGPGGRRRTRQAQDESGRGAPNPLMIPQE